MWTSMLTACKILKQHETAYHSAQICFPPSLYIGNGNFGTRMFFHMASKQSHFSRMITHKWIFFATDKAW